MNRGSESVLVEKKTHLFEISSGEISRGEISRDQMPCGRMSRAQMPCGCMSRGKKRVRWAGSVVVVRPLCATYTSSSSAYGSEG